MDKKLEKGVHVRYRITTLKYLNNDFSVVGKIDEDYLGIIKAATMWNVCSLWKQESIWIEWI